MNNFLDKVKKGVSDASSKAKTMVDINKLKSQISQLNKEIDEEYKRIGLIVFNSFKDNNEENANEQIEERCNVILKKLEEINAINREVMELTNEKKCSCGANISMDAKFCPSCGKKFEDAVKEEEVKKIICSQCNAELEEEAKFCPNCGNLVK